MSAAENRRAPAFGPNRLDILANLARGGFLETSRPAVSGVVTELSLESSRVEGISGFAEIDDLVRFEVAGKPLLGQIVRIGTSDVTVKPVSSFHSIRIGMRCTHLGALTVCPAPSWKGRVLNAFAKPVDDRGELQLGDRRLQLHDGPPPALSRGRVHEHFATGVKIIDLFAPLCRGQRIGIFAGSGVGKSTLLRMLAATPDFDTVVIALVGERGREVREFLEATSAPARDKTVTIVSTSDESSMMRRMAPATAVCTAEYFRDRGEKVLLIVDSITRFAHAARDVAIAAGEPPIARGYTPGVFSDLVRLLERSGPGSNGSGSITGVFSVLLDGDDHDEPIADTIRGTLDGHIVLDRAIAAQGRYPAVDPLKSLSRLAPTFWSDDQTKLVTSLRAMISRYEEAREIRLLGGYKPGADKLLDQANEMIPGLYDWLGQSESDPRCPDVYRAVAEYLSAGIKARG